MKNKVIFAISALMGLMMINSGMNKFLQYMPMPEMPMEAGKLMMAFMESGWLMPLIALVEIIGGALLIVPKLRALGAIMLLPITIGILAFHITLAPETVVISIVLFAINAWIIFENKNKYMPMIKD